MWKEEAGADSWDCSGIRLERLRKPRNISLKIVRVSVDIRTLNLSNTSQKAPAVLVEN
jgi:hypothetical protein